MTVKTKISITFSCLALITAFMLFAVLKSNDPTIFSRLWEPIRCLFADCSSEFVVQALPADFNLSYIQYSNLIRYLILFFVLISLLFGLFQAKAERKSLPNSISTIIACAASSMLLASLCWIP